MAALLSAFTSSQGLRGAASPGASIAKFIAPYAPAGLKPVFATRENGNDNANAQSLRFTAVSFSEIDVLSEELGVRCFAGL
jgi:hypothetical protein